MIHEEFNKSFAREGNNCIYKMKMLAIKCKKTSCKRMAQNKSGYCGLHGKNNDNKDKWQSLD